MVAHHGGCGLLALGEAHVHHLLHGRVHVKDSEHLFDLGAFGCFVGAGVRKGEEKGGGEDEDSADHASSL